ncbi:MAG: EFR1 family ferrodoxin [Oscillospiraceae bacterium]|nr:EFR1 family ferrodoxin [Oscillospiraceae bacterium]
MIVYFSGTGNSRFVAKRIAAATGDELFDAFSSVREGKGFTFPDSGVYVFVSPIYVSAPPMAFLDFLRRSSFPDGCLAYFVMTCAGGMGGAPAYCRKLASEKGFTYLGTAEVEMPQNYIAMFKTGTPEENRAKIEAALPEIDRIAATISSCRELPDPGMKTWEYLSTEMVLTPYYKAFMSAKAFTATDKCIGCGKCASVCPLGNITLQDRKPVWGGHCTHCMACINQCPKEAIEYGKGTRGKLRYHGPDALMKDRQQQKRP